MSICMLFYFILIVVSSLYFFFFFFSSRRRHTRYWRDWSSDVCSSDLVEQITAEGVFMRVQVRATNADQWRVGRELRMRLKERFAAEGIRTPTPLLRSEEHTPELQSRQYLVRRLLLEKKNSLVHLL